MSTATLTLDLNARRGMEAFLQALDDPRARLKLNATNLSSDAEQLLKLVQDQKFSDMAVPLAKRILKYRTQIAGGEISRDDVFVEEVRKEGEQVQKYLEDNYPEGFQLLKNYAEMVRPNILAGAIGVNLDVAANAEAVANAVVWANAAAATLVVVAAAAVVVIAVFVP